MLDKKIQEQKLWPIRPDHITNDGEKLGLEGIGIISNRHLQGYQSEISAIVSRPTAIIEFSTNSYPVRTDSPFLNLSLNPICQKFRNLDTEFDSEGNSITGKSCRICDNCHAELFYGSDKTILIDGLITESFKEKKTWSTIEKLYSNKTNGLDEKIDTKIKYIKKNERIFIEYDCPLLGFKELAFPVFFEGKVIAVFFVGGLIIEGNENNIRNKIKSINERRNILLVDDYLELNIDDLLDVFDKYIIDRSKSIINEDSFNDIIFKTTNELNKFEEILNEEMKHQRMYYIRHFIEFEIKEFSKYQVIQMYDKSDTIEDEDLLKKWNKVDESIARLREYFSFNYIMVFGTGRIVHRKDRNLLVQAASEGHPFNNRKLKELKLNTNLFPKEYSIFSTKNNPEKFEVLTGCNIDELGDCQLILVPSHPHPHSSIGFLINFKEKFPSDASENLFDADLHLTLQSFIILIVSSVASTLARGAEDLAKQQLLYLGHEAGQLAAGLDWLRLTYEDASGLVKNLQNTSNGNNYYIINGLKKKIEDLCEDIKGYPGLMSFFFDTARRLGSDELPTATPTYFWPYGNVLGKWKDTYRFECEKKCLQIRVEMPHSTFDRWRPKMFSDKFLFEQVVYNLVNNAEKYCYRGTKIHIDCKLEELNQTRPKHILTVKNYGRYMPPTKDLYLPFKRSKTNGNVEGLGLGLYIVALIVETVMSGSVMHECNLEEEPASKFNVPLIEPYIQRSFEGKNHALLPELISELDRLKSIKIYNTIVAFEVRTEDNENQASPKYIPSDEELRNEINNPTYEVIITAIMPKMLK